MDGLVKSPSIPHSGRARVEPFEFTSNGGGGEALSPRVKRREATFYEVIKNGGQQWTRIQVATKLAYWIGQEEILWYNLKLVRHD